MVQKNTKFKGLNIINYIVDCLILINNIEYLKLKYNLMKTGFTLVFHFKYKIEKLKFLFTENQIVNTGDLTSILEKINT